MTRILTKRKAKWVKRRNPDVVRGTALNFNASLESRYYTKLMRLINRMTEETERTLERLYNKDFAQEYFAQDDSIAAQARIIMNALFEKYQRLFDAESKPLAEDMASQADAASSSAMHSSMQQLSGGLSLPTRAITDDMKEILSATVTENVGLIRSISAQYLEGVQGAVMRSITSGNGFKDLVPYIEKHKGITQRRARMIANDQTRKAYNNLNKGRMQKLGVKKFEWLHTGGSNEPRKLHIDYSGKIFSFDDLPIIDKNTGERGIPGQAINCRCRMVPVIDFEDE